MRKVILALAFCVGAALFIAAFSVLLLLLLPPWKGRRLETWETTNATLKIRIDRHAEANGWFVPGAYYVFQSSAPGSDEWGEVMTFRHDDPVDIPREQVRFAGERVAYVFMGWMYAMTADGGRSWRVSEMSDFLPSGEKCLYQCIEDIWIESDGTGEARLQVKASSGYRTRVLKTDNYGRSWREP